MVPESAIPTFLGVVAGPSAGVDCGHHTTRLGPSYRLPIWLDSFYDVVNAGGHLGPFEALFDVNPHLGQFSFLLVVFSSLGQHELLVSFQSSVPPLQLLLFVVALAESMDVSEDAVVVEVEEGAIKGDVHDCLFPEGIPTD